MQRFRCRECKYYATNELFFVSGIEETLSHYRPVKGRHIHPHELDSGQIGSPIVRTLTKCSTFRDFCQPFFLFFGFSRHLPAANKGLRRESRNASTINHLFRRTAFDPPLPSSPFRAQPLQVWRGCSALPRFHARVCTNSSRTTDVQTYPGHPMKVSAATCAATALPQAEFSNRPIRTRDDCTCPVAKNASRQGTRPHRRLRKPHGERG